MIIFNYFPCYSKRFSKHFASWKECFFQIYIRNIVLWFIYASVCMSLCMLFIFVCYLFFVNSWITINLEIRSADQDIGRNDDFITHLINFIKNSA